MNLLDYNHNINSLFLLSFRVYKKNFISILFLTLILMTPAFLLSIAGWGQTESIVFFISAHILEGAICLGIIGTNHSEQSLLSKLSPKSPIVEGFRALRSNIRY